MRVYAQCPILGAATLTLLSGFWHEGSKFLAQEKAAGKKPVTTSSTTTCFFCQFCAGCHCGTDRKGNSKWNACSLESLTKEKPSADVLEEYPKAKAYVVPGKPEESLAWLRVANGSMPRGKGAKPADKDKE